jgi:hypothetical protein
MRQRLGQMLYDDTDKDAAEALRSSVVAKAERSPAAVTKQTTGRTEDGLPVHSFRSLLADLATLTRNTLVTAIDPERSFTLTRDQPLCNRRRTISSASLVPSTSRNTALFREIRDLLVCKEGSSG